MIEPMQPDPVEAVRPLSAAEQLAVRFAGHALAQSAVWCTLHIGGANLPSRATCDSTVAPAVAHGRPGALESAEMQDAPGASATSGQRKPFGAVTSIRSPITMATNAHMPPAAAFPTHACCCCRDACIPYA